MNGLFTELPVLLIVIPLAGVPVLYFTARRGLGTALPALAVILFVVILLSSGARDAMHTPVVTAAGGWQPDLGIGLQFDLLAVAAMLVTSLIVAQAILSHDETSGAQHFRTLLMLLYAGSNGLMLTQDLFNAYVFIEITSIASYALVASRQDKGGFESAFKYVVMGSFAGLLVLWGIAGLYLTTGTLDIQSLAPHFDAAPGTTAALSAAAIIAGLLIKLGQVPFHAWKADSLSGASYTVSALLSGVTTTAFFVLLLRVLSALPSLTIRLAPILTTIASLSIITGHLMALRQPRYSRLLAYSSVAHIGYGLLAVSSGAVTAIAAGLFHILVHAIMKSSLFFLGRSFLHTGNRSDRLEAVVFPEQYRKLHVTVYVLLAMSMIGIPPVLGFTSKWYAVLETARAGYRTGAVLIALGGAVALVYYLRVGLQLVHTGLPELSYPGPASRRLLVPIAGTALILMLAVFSDQLLGFCVLAVMQLLEAA